MSREAVAEDRQAKPQDYEAAARQLLRRAPLNCIALAELRDLLSTRRPTHVKVAP